MPRTLGTQGLTWLGARSTCLALVLALGVEACEPSPVSPPPMRAPAPTRLIACDPYTGCPEPPPEDPQNPEPTYDLQSYSGSVSSLIVCPTNVAGLGPLPYAGKVWTTMNGPFKAVGRTLTKTRYKTVSGWPTVFGDLRFPWDGGGSRAIAQEWLVSCVTAGPGNVATFDVSSFVPIGWLVTYDTDQSPGDGGGGGGGSCDYQIIYDPSTCDPEGGGGGGGGGPEPVVTTQPGDNGGTDLCVELFLDPGCYDVYIDGEYDGTICCN